MHKSLIILPLLFVIILNGSPLNNCYNNLSDNSSNNSIIHSYNSTHCNKYYLDIGDNLLCDSNLLCHKFNKFLNCSTDQYFSIYYMFTVMFTFCLGISILMVIISYFCLIHTYVCHKGY